MPIATPTPVPALATDLPDPSDRTTYGLRGRAVWDWEVNTMVPGINAVGQAAYENAVAAEDAAQAASAAANFKGSWSSLTGALAKPAAVSHSGTVWALLNDLVDVTTSQPGVSADWFDIGGVKRTGDTMTGHLNVLAGASGTQAPQAQEVALLATTQLGFRNKVVNGNFAVNQGGVTGTVVLAAGAYGHDQWKAGAAGCTYTFATSAGVTTLTISAGSLIQPIEGVSLRTGTHTLSWTGTSQGKIDAGSYGASGLTGSITGGADTTIEFNTGTLSLVQLEPGLKPTVFEFLDPTIDLLRCQRYYQPGRAYLRAYGIGAQQLAIRQPFTCRMRVAPTVVSSFSYANMNTGTVLDITATGASHQATITATNGAYFDNTFTANARM